MKRVFQLFFTTVIVVALFYACSKEGKNANLNMRLNGQNTYAWFAANLHAGMDYQGMKETFGEPAKDIGSGIHIYVYLLDDETEIWIGYTDRMLYARHMDKQMNLLHELVNNLDGSEG
jgi:hypothetical protein